MQTFKKYIRILDAERNRFLLTIEVTDRNWCLQFTMSWEWLWSSGQNIDSINPNTESQEKIIQFWKDYHIKEINEWIYDELVEMVLPELEEESKAIQLISDDIERLQEILDETGHRKYSDRQIAIALMLDLPEEELEEDVDIDEADKTYIEIQGSNYYFGTDEEMEDQHKESIEQTTDDCYIDNNLKDSSLWKRWYITIDYDRIADDTPRSEQLASYDWDELSQTIDWVDYYMYKC